MGPIEQDEIMLVGLRLKAPWKLLDQQLDLDPSPHNLQREVGSDRSTRFEFPQCDKVCTAHDYQTRR